MWWYRREIPLVGDTIQNNYNLMLYSILFGWDEFMIRHNTIIQNNRARFQWWMQDMFQYCCFFGVDEIFRKYESTDFRSISLQSSNQLLGYSVISDAMYDGSILKNVSIYKPWVVQCCNMAWMGSMEPLDIRIHLMEWDEKIAAKRWLLFNQPRFYETNLGRKAMTWRYIAEIIEFWKAKISYRQRSSLVA